MIVKKSGKKKEEIMEFSKYIDAAAAKYSESNEIPLEEAFDALMSVIFGSNCDILDLLEWNMYPQPDIDFVW